MLEHTTISCPFCSKEIPAKSITVGKRIVYVVEKDCYNCGSAAQKIESELNKSNRRSNFNVEKSYIKVDPRG